MCFALLSVIDMSVFNDLDPSNPKFAKTDCSPLAIIGYPYVRLILASFTSAEGHQMNVEIVRFFDNRSRIGLPLQNFVTTSIHLLQIIIIIIIIIIQSIGPSRPVPIQNFNF
jgi:hypothetical protein